MEYESIIEPFIARVKKNPDDLAVVMISEDEPDLQITYAELMVGAKRVAWHLQNSGIHDQDVVLLVLPFSVTLLEAIWGTLLLGAIPSVHTYIHSAFNENTYIKKVHGLVESSEIHLILTTGDVKNGWKELYPESGHNVLADEEIKKKIRGDISVPDISTSSAENIAVLQFSSGSTGQRKGVMLSHRAIFGYVDGLQGVIKRTEDDVHVNWLPLYHDLGLVFGLFMPIFLNYITVLMSPIHWIYRPEILFQAVSKYGGTSTWMPNFAFKHSLRISDNKLEGVDLSSWVTIGNGAEPVEVESFELFYDKFSEYGLKKTALASGYGLAEQVAGMSRTKLNEPPNVDWIDRDQLQNENQAVPVKSRSDNSKAFVSCGPPYDGVEVKIVGNNGERLSERHVGEIAIRGRQMFSGYYQQPELTAEVVRDGWFYTGDLGYLFEGEIYICGRKKDLIIVGGDNIYPQDIEAVVGEFSVVRPGRAVAFGVSDDSLGTERVVVVAELKKPTDSQEKSNIANDIRQQVFEELNIRVAKVHLVEEKGWVIKTSSGKMARTANKEKYIKSTK